ncbi:hypothetical protein OS493_037546 [Desmophyllum pertusum]|uniref:Uncharacterized protein n=1 Tax=Desmophyllum pertusum TaxID=174260 RepID=A0A9W9Z7U8_9CNID|nr:hypothetical protein OS493_037546 [Desmophyllum pertusum]
MRQSYESREDFLDLIMHRFPLLPEWLVFFITSRPEDTRENSDRDEQQVIDAVSQFVVLRSSDQTLTFLHNLIPACLTDKKKSSRKLFIDKKIAGEYLRKVFVEILSAVVNEPPSTCTSIDEDLEDYVSRFGVRFCVRLVGKIR